MVSQKKDFRRLLLVLMSFIVVAFFFLVNASFDVFILRPLLIFIGLGVVAYFFMKNERSGIGIDSNIGTDFFYGLLFGGFFIGLTYTGLSIGIPQISASLEQSAKFFIVVIAAPVIEPIFFRAFVMKTLLIDSYNFKPFLAIVVQAIIFALYHFAAYGGFVFNIGSFVAALIFGLVAGWVVYRTNSVLPEIVGHALVNGFLIASLSVVIL